VSVVCILGILENIRDRFVFAKHYRVQEEKRRGAGRNCLPKFTCRLLLPAPPYLLVPLP